MKNLKKSKKRGEGHAIMIIIGLAIAAVVIGTSVVYFGKSKSAGNAAMNTEIPGSSGKTTNEVMENMAEIIKGEE